MLHFNRIRPGFYMSDCRKFAIMCVGYPPAWNIYTEDCNGDYQLIGTRSLLCLAKTAANEYRE